MSADIFVHVVSRFVHIACGILFLGGVVYARQVLVPTLNLLPEEPRRQSAVAAQAFFRNTLFSLLILIVLSGLYNFLVYQGPKHTLTYQIWFGIKMVAVAHLFATAILWGTSPFGDVYVGGKNSQRTISMAISGLVAVFISSYLRSLSQRGL